MGYISQGAGGQQEASLPPSRCHQPLPPWEAANGAGSCRGWFVFPSPGINPWQIRGAPGEQTRPGQGENMCSQPGKQLHVQGFPLARGFATLALPNCSEVTRGQVGQAGGMAGGDGRSHAAMGSRHTGTEGCEPPVSPLGMLSSTTGPAEGTQLHPVPLAPEWGLSPGKDMSQGGHLDH